MHDKLETIVPMGSWATLVKINILYLSTWVEKLYAHFCSSLYTVFRKSGFLNMSISSKIKNFI